MKKSNGLNPEPALRVLSAVLLEPSLWPKVESLALDDFRSPALRDVFSTMKLLAARQEPITRVNIAEEQRESYLEFDALEHDLFPTPQPKEIDAYLDRFKRETLMHDAVHAVDKVYQKAVNGGITHADLLELGNLGEQLQNLCGQPEAGLFQSLEEYEGAAPMKFAIDGFLQENAVNAIAGLSGHGKTWLALSVTRALLFGPGKLWDLFAVRERAARVIYLIPESTIGPFKYRLEKMGLYDEIRSGRLLTRTLSKGPAPLLQDPRLLRAAKGAHVICDTGIRFMLNVADENSATEAAKGLSEDFFALLRAEAKSILALFHSPKAFNVDKSMTLESMIRGSGEFGAMLAAAWGIKQIDAASNTVHVENLKARDFEACRPFELVGRPAIDDTGDFQLCTRPGDCEDLKKLNEKRADGKDDRVQIVMNWLKEDPEPTGPEMVERFAAMGITVEANTVYKYRTQARKALG